MGKESLLKLAPITILLPCSTEEYQLSNGTVVTVGESSSADGDLIQNEGFSDLVIILNK